MKISRNKLKSMLKEEFDKVDRLHNRFEPTSDLDVFDTEQVLEDLEESEDAEDTNESKTIKITQRSFVKLVVEAMMEQDSLDAPDYEETSAGKEHKAMEEESEAGMEALNFIKANVKSPTDEALIKLYRLFLNRFGNDDLFGRAIESYINMSEAYADEDI